MSNINNCTKYLQKQGKSYPRTCQECGLSGCKFESFTVKKEEGEVKAVSKKRELKDLTFEEYNTLKIMGFLWGFYPNATGSYILDCPKMTDGEKIKKLEKELSELKIEIIQKYKLKSIDTAPKDRYILVAGRSGYSSTPLRFDVCRFAPSYKEGPEWRNYANDSFTDSGSEAEYWMEIPTV